MTEDLKNAVSDEFTAQGLDDGLLFPADGLIFVKHSRISTWTNTVYEPNVCLVLSGVKETRVGKDIFQIKAGHVLLVSHHLPVSSQVTKATRESPYLAVVVKLDIPTLHSVANQLDKMGRNRGGATSFAVDVVPEDLLETIHRYVRTARDHAAARILGPAQFKELHFRLLISSHGGMLLDLISLDTHASKIAKSIQIINDDFKKPLSMTNLARQVGMCTSAFYKHFKRITRMTPLQYQKQIRMHEAERFLTSGSASVTEAAFKVGYESLPQFSREYSRKFGVSPKSLKRAGV